MITYFKGDATEPVCRPALIVHVCNNVGGWGAGFVLAISNKWKEPEREYRKLFQIKEKVSLGEVQFISVEPDVYICNMIAQDGIFKRGHLAKRVYINYNALEQALIKVAIFAEENELSIHMPRIGCGLAGGKWEIVEDIISQKLKNLDIYVYDL